MLDDEMWIRRTGKVTLTGKTEVSGEKAVVPVPHVHHKFFVESLQHGSVLKTHATHTHTHTHTQLYVR